MSDHANRVRAFIDLWDERRNKWGHVAVSCTHGIGHLGPHHDAHAARSWED